MNNGNISKYKVVDKIVLLGPFSTQVSIDMVFEKVENGSVVDTTTALRTRIKHYWSVRQTDSGEGVEIIERVNIQVSVNSSYNILRTLLKGYALADYSTIPAYDRKYS
jgi:hypothetical protein